MTNDNKSSLEKKYEYAWDRYTQEDLKNLFELSERYKTFITKCKTERECITEFISLAERQGYRSMKEIIEKGSTLKPGGKKKYIKPELFMMI